MGIQQMETKNFLILNAVVLFIDLAIDSTYIIIDFV